MKIKENILNGNDVLLKERLLVFLQDFVNYSIDDINSYDELTFREKSLISREDFNKLCE